MSSRLTKRNTKNSAASDRENNLLEQVKSLQEENSRLQALLAARDSNNDLTPRKSKNNATNIRSRQHSPSSQQNISAIPTSTNTPRTRNKGCSCKGNCATRVCGCVKNNIPCAEFCRCGNALCQNQEEDKENIGGPMNQAQLSKEGEESMQKLSQLTIREGKKSKQEIPPVASRSNKRIENVKKNNHLFSPNNTGNSPDFTDITFDSLSFGDTTTVEVAANNSNEKEKNFEIPTTSAKNENPKEPQSRHNHLQVQDPPRKMRSLSAKEDTSKQSTMGNTGTRKRSMSTDGSSKTKRPTKLVELIGGLKSRRPRRPRTVIFTSEKDNDSSNSTQVDKTHAEDIAVKQDKKKPGRKQKKSATVEKQNSKQDPSKTDGESSNDNSETNYEKKDKKRSSKKGNKSEPMEKQNRKKATMKSTDKSDSDNSETDVPVKSKKQPAKKGNKIIPEAKQEDGEDSNESDGHNSQNTSITRNETSLEQPAKVVPMESSNSEDHYSSREIKTEVEETHQNSDSCNSEYSPTNTAAIPGNADLLQMEANETFDPMKPTRELSRSPRNLVKRSPIQLQSSSIPRRILDLSEIPLPVPLPEEPEIEPQLPEELNTDIVDWEKHQETLLECGKCGRKFFPLRLKKHESSCHKI